MDGESKVGRPSIYSDELAAKICERIAAGDSLHTICAMDDMPAQSTVYLWLARNPEFSEQYTRARENQMEHWADKILDICDTEEDVNRARLKVDARKWLMARLAPKKYGDKIKNEVSGPDGGAVPVSMTLRRTIVDPTAEGE